MNHETQPLTGINIAGIEHEERKGPTLPTISKRLREGLRGLEAPVWSMARLRTSTGQEDAPQQLTERE
jgi:hypothetical protein